MSKWYCVQVREVHHKFIRITADDERSAMKIVLDREAEDFPEYLDPIISGIEIVRCDPEDNDE